ncbi:MAG: hypothetical protein A2X58_06305 [Nitrospirae bacterium GWC2_56_14]|nr:MAG: hypothetical protein A2X58_06305 [Nitrospirae bacterium GWC2_56_14]
MSLAIDRATSRRARVFVTTLLLVLIFGFPTFAPAEEEEEEDNSDYLGLGSVMTGQDDRDRTSSSLSLGLSFASGNSDLSSIHGGAKVNQNSPRLESMTDFDFSVIRGAIAGDDGDGGDAGLQEPDTKKRITEKGELDLLGYFFPDKTFFPAMHLKIETDKNAGVRWRALGGPGLGMRFMKTDSTNLTVVAGVSRTQERTTQGERDKFHAFHAETQLRQKLSPNAGAASSLQFDRNMSDDEDIRLQWESDLNFRISQTVAFQATFTAKFDKKPVQHFERRDYLLHFSLLWGNAPAGM